MDYSEIKKVVEMKDVEKVNRYLATGRWVLLGDAPGQYANKESYHLYSLGWLGPYDPEFPENDNSEFLE